MPPLALCLIALHLDCRCHYGVFAGCACDVECTPRTLFLLPQPHDAQGMAQAMPPVGLPPTHHSTWKVKTRPLQFHVPLARVPDVKMAPTESYRFAIVTQSHVALLTLNPLTGGLATKRPPLSTFRRRFTAATFTSLGDLLLIATTSGDVGILSSSDGTLLATPRAFSCPGTSQPGVQAATPYARFAAGERTSPFLLGGADGQVVQANIIDHTKPRLEKRATACAGAHVTDLAVRRVDQAASGKHEVLVGTAKGTVLSLSACDEPPGLVSTGPPICDCPVGGITDVVFSPNNTERAVLSGRDGLIRAYNLGDYSVDCCSDGLTSPPRQPQWAGSSTGSSGGLAASERLPVCIDYSSAHDVVVSGWTDCTISCMDGISGSPLWSLPRAHRTPPTMVRIFRDLKHFVSTGSEPLSLLALETHGCGNKFSWFQPLLYQPPSRLQGELCVFRMADRSLVSSAKGHTGPVTDLNLISSSTHALTAGDQTVVLWDVARMTAVSRLPHQASVHSITGSQDFSSVWSVGPDCTVNRWDLRAPTHPVWSDAAGPPGVSGVSVSLSPCGPSLLAFGLSNHQGSLWDADNARPLPIQAGHTAQITRLAWAPDAKQVASVGLDS
eukprot:gene9545-1714_t